jgi:putative sterol carrier protein
MEKMYRPGRAGKFRGEIEFTLTTARGDEVWTVDIQDKRAVARRGGSDTAALQVKAKLTDFVRVGTGNADPVGAVLAGKLQVNGDFNVAAKLGEMFGGKSFF